jgi:hypothetical protein
MSGTDPRPSAIEASRHTARAVHDVGAKFMLDLDMYVDVATLGYEGTSFYFAGRGGVLGDVDHSVVHQAFTFFPAGTVEQAWDASAEIEPRSEAAERFAGYAARWATANIPDGTGDLTRLAELCGAVIAAADATDAPVFAGWRDLPEPDGERELVVHRMNALRELRAARHGAAVRRVGLEPVDAFFIRTPYMAAIFGWPEPTGEPDAATRARWDEAEALTDSAFAADLAVLSDEELDEFCELTDELLGVVG